VSVLVLNFGRYALGCPNSKGVMRRGKVPPAVPDPVALQAGSSSSPGLSCLCTIAFNVSSSTGPTPALKPLGVSDGIGGGPCNIPLGPVPLALPIIRHP